MSNHDAPLDALNEQPIGENRVVDAQSTTVRILRRPWWRGFSIWCGEEHRRNQIP